MHETADTAPSPLQQAFEHAQTSCIKCGFCLPTCPTYRLTGNEADSPRGRIDLMSAVAQGDLEAHEIVRQLDFCLGCRACETACPAGVTYGTLLEAGRAMTRAQRNRAPLGAWVEKVFLEALLPSPRSLRWLATFLRLYQKSGLQRLVRFSNLLPQLAPTLGSMEALLPPVPSATARHPLAEDIAPQGEERGRVLLLTGCIMPQVLPQVNRATAHVLAANGYRVLAPRAQRCCGALQTHAGDNATARGLARQLITLFETSGANWLVVNSAGCGALLKEYGHLLADDAEFAGRARDFSARVCDVSEILTMAPLRGRLQPVPVRAAYDDPCHLLHGQKIREQPRALLRQVPGLQLLDVPEGDWCCGSAGTYNLLQPKTAQELLDRKMRHIAALEPQLIVTGNPGCMLQLRYGVMQHKLAVEVLHPVELLARAYGVSVE